DDSTPSTALTATISSLTNGQSYDVQVLAQNVVGPSAWSDTAAATPATTPSAPTLLSLVPGSNRAIVNWDAPASDGGSAITGYQVESNLTSATPWTDAGHSGTATTLTISGLPAQSHDVRVSATNAAGSSAPSTAASATPLATTAPAAPAAPALMPGNAQLGVSWAAPSSDGGSAITDYDVRWRQTGTTSWTELDDSTPSTALTATISSLTNGQSYDVEVRAQNVVGPSAWSDTAAATPATVPGAPTLLSVVPGNNRAVASWSAPASDGGAAVNGYQTQWRTNSGIWFDNIIRTVNNGNARSATIVTQSGFASSNGNRRDIRVRARNARGVGPWSNELSVVPGTPTAPSGVTAAAGELSGGSQPLVVSWTASNGNGAAITQYNVQYQVGTSGATATANAAGGATSLTITAVTNGSEYRARVRGVNSRGTSAWSAWTDPLVQVVGSPDAPTAPALVAANAQLTFSWTAPTNTGGGALSGYDVQYKLTGASVWIDATHSGTGTTITVSSLDNAMSYDFRVRARNSAGPSDWSAIAMGIPGQAAAPTGVGAVAGTGSANIGAMTVRWTAPSTTGGSAIASYEVEYQVGTAGATATATQGTPATTSLRITGLTKSTQYRARVRAVNALTNGAWSAYTALVTARGVPDAPPAPRLSFNSAISLSANLDAPANTGGSAITGYVVQRKNAGADDSTYSSANVQVVGSVAALSQLTTGQPYEVRVRAVNAQGVSPWSPTAQLTPSTAPDLPPRNVAADGRNTALAVTWTAPSRDQGSPITGYNVQWKLGSAPDGDYASTNVVVDGLTAMISSLVNGSVYDVRVRAVNARGPGPWGAAQGTPRIRVPDAPAAPMLTPGNTQLTVEWVAPADGGNAI
ncbi:MAG: fibronectin type III domain-containing protein, partial [Hyphomicrobiales bacterium]|nr:fibronectin type III domain-containing protein [Hyphomicrobiales bacterium]